jgi:hypothetical protein
MITIRRAVAGDADALAALNLEFNGVCRSRSDIQETLDRSSEEVLVAELDQRVRGFGRQSIAAARSVRRNPPSQTTHEV